MSTTILSPASATESDTDARSTRCHYVRDDFTADLDAIVLLRRRNGEPRLKRSHVIEEAIAQWLALNSQKYRYRLISNGHTDAD